MLVQDGFLYLIPSDQAQINSVRYVIVVVCCSKLCIGLYC
jgi:hypothetical protein